MNTTYKLVVVHPFADYKRGDVITDPQLASDILNPNSKSNYLKTKVVKVANKTVNQTVSD